VTAPSAPAPSAPAPPAPAPVVPAPAPAPAQEEVEPVESGVDASRSGSPVAGRALLEDSLARLAAAGDDVGAAENHVNGLAELLIVSVLGGGVVCVCGGARGGAVCVDTGITTRGCQGVSSRQCALRVESGPTYSRGHMNT
jgi:hypothetical protein